MKRESFQGILLGIVIMCAVFAFITIAWAAFSSTLTIGGTATVEKASWKVVFTDTDGVDVTGTGKTLTGTPKSNTNADISTATLAISSDGLTISGIVGKLMGAGDEIVYDWKVKNFGTFDAELVSIDTDLLTAAAATTGSNIAITCASSDVGAVANDITTWCASHIAAKLYISPTGTASGSEVLALRSGASGSEKYSVDIKKAGTTGNTDVLDVKLVVTFIGSTNETAANNIEVTIPQITFSANQDTTSS